MNVSSVKNLNGESFSAVQDAALTDFVSSNSASWTGGGGGGVSGTNVVFVPQYEGANYGGYYSARISGDVVVRTGDYFGADIMPGREYSLSSVGANIGNKLDKNKIEDSNTIKIINDHAEVTDKAYRPVGFSDMSATHVDIREFRVDIEFNSQYVGIDSRLVSAIVTVETTAAGSYIPDGWSLVSYENNSAIFTKSYPLNERVGSFQLYADYGGWRDFTNAEGSATVYSALELATLAFKDDITGGGATYSAGANIDITDNVISAKDWSSNIIAATSGLQPSGDYYSASNPSGFITALPEEEEVEFEELDLSDYLTAVPAGTMNESAFAYDASNNITAYNGSAFKAGDEFPQSATEAIETVTSSSAMWNETTDTVSSNSGAWGGSALPISAGPGIKFEMVDNTLVASTDETVLWSGTAAPSNFPLTMSEPITNFETVKFYWQSFSYAGKNHTVSEKMTDDSDITLDTFIYNKATSGCYNVIWELEALNTTVKNVATRFASWTSTATPGDASSFFSLYKIVGINRISGDN